MAINVSVQYNGEFFPDIMLLTLCSNIGGPIKSNEVILSLQPISHLNVSTSFPLTGCSEGLDAFRFFLKYKKEKKEKQRRQQAFSLKLQAHQPNAILASRFLGFGGVLNKRPLGHNLCRRAAG